MKLPDVEEMLCACMACYWETLKICLIPMSIYINEGEKLFAIIPEDSSLLSNHWAYLDIIQGQLFCIWSTSFYMTCEVPMAE